LPRCSVRSAMVAMEIVLLSWDYSYRRKDDSAAAVRW